MKTLKTTLALAMTTVSLLVACEHSDSGKVAVPGTTAYREYRVGVTNVQAQNFDQRIVDQLAAQRCDREQSCSNVGAGKRYDSRGVCMDWMLGDLGNTLNAHECPLGIDREGFDQCTAAIKAEGCGDGVAIFNRARQCRASALCLK
jgi:hypothetical protein